MLEQIKNDFRQGKIEHFRAVDGLTDGQVKWLIEQAEEVKRLESFIETLQVSHFVELQREKATVERYEKALKEILEVGYSNAFGGGTEYTGENHGECRKIARKALND